MRIGVLDIGSTAAQLQVVEAYPGAPPLATHAVKRPTRLGEAITPDGAIDAAGADRVVAAVREVMDAARGLAIDRLYAFATSVVRDATNRDEVVACLEQEAGLRPQFLSGEHEAELVYHAAHRWYGWSAGRLLVLDIGGGSMEIVFGRDATPEVAVSLPLGAGRLTRAFLADDPPTQKQIKALRRHVRGALREVADRLAWEGGPVRAAATSKTFLQLARLAGAPALRKGPFVRRCVTAEALAAWIPRLAALPAAERAKLPGISRPRARQILAGAIVARAAMSALNVGVLDVCPWALREGVLLRHIEVDHPPADLPLRPVGKSLASVRPLPRWALDATPRPDLKDLGRGPA